MRSPHPPGPPPRKHTTQARPVAGAGEREPYEPSTSSLGEREARARRVGPAVRSRSSSRSWRSSCTPPSTSTTRSRAGQKKSAMNCPATSIQSRRCAIPRSIPHRPPTRWRCAGLHEPPSRAHASEAHAPPAPAVCPACLAGLRGGGPGGWGERKAAPRQLLPPMGVGVPRPRPPPRPRPRPQILTTK